MTLIPVSHWRFRWFPSGLLGGGGRGGPGRLIGIVAGIALAVGAVVVVSVRSHHSEPASQVAKMKAGSLLPGGLMGTPAQDALLKTDSQEKAKKAEAVHVSIRRRCRAPIRSMGTCPRSLASVASRSFRRSRPRRRLRRRASLRSFRRRRRAIRRRPRLKERAARGS